MIKPYTAVGLIPTVRGIRKRADIKINLEHLEHLVKAASWLSSLDWWIQRYGRNLDAFWPVVDTEIGRLGIMMANEGSYPENARALAMNGAEVVYRASYPHPATGNEIFEIQSRARALDNNMYIVAPNMWTYYLFPQHGTPIHT